MDSDKNIARVDTDHIGPSSRADREHAIDEVLSWTDDEEAEVRHKLDWHILPLLILLYLFCFLDRVNIGNARIQGMESELGLNEGVRFNWALSVFFITYLLVEVPSNMVLKRVGPRFYLPLLECGFGLVTMCTAFVTRFPGLLVTRAALGIFEGGVMPGMAFFLSCFYKPDELFLRIGIFISSASLAGAFGGLLAAALSRIPAWGVSGAVELQRWRNIYFFEGLASVLVGLAAPLWMPASPQMAAFLTPRERRIAAERLCRVNGEGADGRVRWRHVRQVFMSVHNNTCALGFFLSNITVQGIALFLPTILRDLRWTSTKAQLLTVPPFACTFATVIAVGYVSDRTGRRGVYIAALALIAVAGFAILRWSATPNLRYMAVFLVMAGAFPAGPGFLGWAMNNSAGPAVRAVSSAYVVTLATFGGIVATWTYRKDDAPKYATGHSINLAGQLGVAVLAALGIAYCQWENRARVQGKRDNRLEGLSELEQVQLGNKHPSFRYWT